MDIRELLALIRERKKSTSLRGLARDLSMSLAVIQRYRDGDAIPNDDTMLRLCDAAGIPPERGLILVNMWRSQGRAHTIYGRLLKSLGADDAQAVQ